MKVTVMPLPWPALKCGLTCQCVHVGAAAAVPTDALQTTPNMTNAAAMTLMLRSSTSPVDRQDH